MTLPRPRARRARSGTPTLVAVAVAALAGAAACRGGGAGGAVEAGGGPRPAGLRAAPPPPDPVRLYRGMGLIAHGEPFPVTGRLVYLAAASPETTVVVVTLAIPNRALTFTHTGDRYHAAYGAAVMVRRGADSVAAASGRESVTVASFRETTRTDDSIIFQQQLRLAPGRYDLLLRLRDEGSDRGVADTATVDVPRLDPGTLGTPVPYYEAVQRQRLDDPPRLLVMPRATAISGRDSTLPVYLEGYGSGAAADTGPVPLRAAVRGAGGDVVWRDSVTLTPRQGGLASGVLALPVARLGIGAVTLDVWRADRPGGGRVDGRDSVHAPLLVALGAGLPAATFDEVLSYLRFFASPARLERLRRTPPAERGAAWAAFLAGVAPDAGGETGGNGGQRELQQYLARIQVADQRYGEGDGDGPGWLTDRGMVFAAFGDPDELLEPDATALAPRGRVQRWVYRERKLRLEFLDVTGFDRWRLAPSSEDSFRAALARLRD